MTRGPNPKRMGEIGAGWTGIDRAAIEERFGARFGEEWNEIYFALIEFTAMRDKAEELPSESNFRADLDGAISEMEAAMKAVDRAIKFDTQNDNLTRIYGDLEADLIEHRKRRGDWPGIEPGEQPHQVMSVSEVKKQTVRRLVEIAEGAGLDPKKLVEACDIHNANSREAWLKWYDRTKL